VKAFFLTIICLLSAVLAPAQNASGSYSLDPGNPIQFGEDYIVYKGQTIPLGPRAFFIDGQLTDAQIAGNPYVFNSVNKAAEHLTNGTEDAPMVLYIAPYVYWIDDPDDPAERVGVNGAAPFGLVIACEWLRFYGLSDNASNVVLACNRGQTMGSRGNFTMFRLIGQGTSSENVTFGNYCNIDLDYPLKPSLSRPKRGSAIVQAQLIMCNGDKIVARNCRFVSRLNLCPFLGGKRVLFDRCHLECTDDALTGTAVYLNCTLDFYSSKPFGGTSGTGAVFLNCDIRSFSGGKQFFTKMDGQIAVVDTRILGKPQTYYGWQDYPPLQTRNYQYNVLVNGSEYVIGNNDPDRTVDMTRSTILEAYRVMHQGNVIYNIWNLLRGDDNWDPMSIRTTVEKAEKESGKNYSMLPVRLSISPSKASIETGKAPVTLSASLFRFGNYPAPSGQITWSIASADRGLVQLNVAQDSRTCVVIPTHTGEAPARVVITASDPSGLQAACVLEVSPSQLDPPLFRTAPQLSGPRDGRLQVAYQLETSYADQSLVSWYRCLDAQGSNPVETAVSREGQPLREYELSAGDIGYYIMATVAPKHIRCAAGKPVSCIMPRPIGTRDITANPKTLVTNFHNTSLRNQPSIIPGFWTWSHAQNPDDERANTTDTTRDAWYFGAGSDGAAGHSGLLQGRSARMLYTPAGRTSGNMKCTYDFLPYKTAGQGFSMAGMYMDVLIQCDTRTMTGFALRLIRTTKFGNAVDALFVRYENGKATEISDPVTTSCYRPGCRVEVEVAGNLLKASLSKYGENPAEPVPGVVAAFSMEKEISPEPWGGFGIEYHGGSSVLIEQVKAIWK